MLQHRISKCVRKSEVFLYRQKWIAPFWRMRFCQKNYGTGCNSESDSEKFFMPGIDQSFEASTVGRDGRNHRFATVVAKSMKSGQSALRIWEQACGLLGTDKPTLAVAFVSRPTESALLAIHELGVQLARTIEPGNSAIVDADRSEPPPPSASCGKSSNEVIWRTGGNTSPSTEGFENPPLIGCIIDHFGSNFEDGSSQSLGNAQGAQVGSIDGSLPYDVANFESQDSVSGRVNHIEEQLLGEGFKVQNATFDPSSTLVVSEGAAVVDDDEGTLSDWEHLCSEYAEVKGQMVGLEDGLQHEDTVDIDIVDSNLSGEESTEGLVTFLNVLTRPKSSQREGVVAEDYLELTQQLDSTLCSLPSKINGARINKGNENGSERSSNVRGLLVLDQGCIPADNVTSICTGTCLSSSATDVIFGNDQGSFIVEKWSEHHPSSMAKEPGSQKSGKVEEGDYKLVLCLGHIPGAKAIAFHSATTGLPSLPNLENAVIVNNPHMLLLGAPGSVSLDLCSSAYLPRRLEEGLSSLSLSKGFPRFFQTGADCRAGAFLAPLFTSKRSQWTKPNTEQQPSPLFFGTRTTKSGVVGLALSSEDAAVGVPVTSFAQLIRMSVGMPRIPGFIFLDEPTSKSLFLPKNIGGGRLALLARSSQMPTSTLLDQLSKQLLKQSTAQLRSKESVDSSMVRQGMGNKTSLDSSEVYSAARNGGSDMENRMLLDRLPLALLDSVLFPGWSMPFHIFEPCYRVMVKECVEQGKPFGLSSILTSWSAEASNSGEVIGTLANLKLHSFERDCRSYIIAHGVRRFRVAGERIWAEPGSFGLTMGEVHFFDDKECETAEEKIELQGLAQQAVSMCANVFSEAHAAPSLMKFVHDPSTVSFAIGHLLNVPNRVKRRWLKMVNTRTRLLEQITFLETKQGS